MTAPRSGRPWSTSSTTSPSADAAGRGCTSTTTRPTSRRRCSGSPARHGVYEDEVDQLLRDGVFVDLYATVRAGIRVSQRSYSIKKLEPLYMDRARG